MNREIKFRAYDHVLEKMLDMRELEKSGMNLFALCEGVNIVKLMQYTGLKDKKGTEIYEGDIVRGRWILDHDIGVVEFWKTGFVVKKEDDRDLLTSDDYEVFGNIYENADLMQWEGE